MKIQAIRLRKNANFTGAGMGMKSPLHRNFEAGILTDDSYVITSAKEEFDKVWRGSECRLCRRKQYCRHVPRSGVSDC